MANWETKLDRYFFTGKMEDKSIARELIDEYDNNTFWDELVDRLAKRDFIGKYGRERVKKMDIKEFFKKLNPFEEKYSSEVRENGLENLEIVDKE